MNAVERVTRSRVPQITMNHRLWLAREHAEIGVERMAQLMGCSRRSITRWEHPGTRVPRAVLLGYHVATQVDLGWIETGVEGAAVESEYTPRDSNPEPADIGSAVVRSIESAPSISRRFTITPEGGEAA